jgi:hypothetical protein
MDGQGMLEQSDLESPPSVESPYRDNYIKGLREMADFLAANPDFPLPSNEVFISCPRDKEHFAQGVRMIGERGKKSFDDNWANYTATFGEVRLVLFISREQVCRRIVERVEHIPEHMEPARDREIVRWECDEPWLDAAEDRRIREQENGK